MRSFIKKICAAASAAALSAVMALSAAAEYPFSFVDCYIEGGEVEGFVVKDEVKVSGTVDDSEHVMTATYALSKDELDLSFWQVPGATVSCDVKLETKGADVFAYMPGFGDGWVWVDPSGTTKLVYDEWITVTETMEHFYSVFKDSAPSRVLIQVRSNTTKSQDVVVSFKNFRIDGVDAAEATTATTAEVTTAEPVDTEPVTVTDESNVTLSETADTAEAAATTATTVTTAGTTAPAETTVRTSPSTTIDYSQYLKKPDNSGMVVTIIVIVVLVVLVIGGAIVGYIIYKKKKYY